MPRTDLAHGTDGGGNPTRGAKGHKGVIYPASPMELRAVPHINEPAYDPLWATCQELERAAVLSRRRIGENSNAPGESFTPAVAAAFGGVIRSVSSVAVVANFLLSRVLTVSRN